MTTIKSRFGFEFKEYEVGKITKVAINEPLRLLSGVKISNFDIAYQTYGKLNEQKSNAILIYHPITGDQYLASENPVTQKDGWWQFMVGPEKPIDTNQYFVICANVIGGCMGSFGPKTFDKNTGKSHGVDFPFITIEDMVRAQKLLLEYLEIDDLLAVIGGSMGGMLALTHCITYPKMAKSVILLSTSFRNSTQNIAFNEVGRQAIMADPDWCNGQYFDENKFPKKGLAVARMAAHITYLSEEALHQKFGRNLQDKNNFSYGFGIDFQVESYLRHQGLNFVKRFDPNSYLYLTKAIDYFDLEAENNGILSNAFKDCSAKFCIISFEDDWLFLPSESRKLAQALNISNCDVSLINLQGGAGHDSFLIENEDLENTVEGFLKNLTT